MKVSLIISLVGLAFSHYWQYITFDNLIVYVIATVIFSIVSFIHAKLITVDFGQNSGGCIGFLMGRIIVFFIASFVITVALAKINGIVYNPNFYGMTAFMLLVDSVLELIAIAKYLHDGPEKKKSSFII